MAQMDDPVDPSIVEKVPHGLPQSARSHSKTIAFIEKRALLRDCFVRCLRGVEAAKIITFPDVTSWARAPEKKTTDLVILFVSEHADIEDFDHELAPLMEMDRELPIVLISNCEGIDPISSVLQRGMRGYIPTSHSLDVAVEAIRLVMAGGIYLPASALTAAMSLMQRGQESQHRLQRLFTSRQSAVLEALRRGKSNKMIAYELNMCESTVKVHVRTIMKKLKAKNRTEVAFLANSLLSSGQIRQLLSSSRTTGSASSR